MEGLAKKIAASVLSLVLVLAVGTTCFAASWDSYFGATSGWYEGADGSLTENTDTGWTADMATIGWGGCWGAQVMRNDVSVVKGQQYALSFRITSTNCPKWVYIKIAVEGDETLAGLAFGDWVFIEAGQTVTYNKTFTANATATGLTFGIGGEMGDRIGVTTDPDAEVRYSLASTTPNDGDSTYSTTIRLTNFSFGPAAPAKPAIKAVKNLKGRKIRVTLRKKISGAAAYQIAVYKTKKNAKNDKKAVVKKTTKKVKLTLKSKKIKTGTRYFVRARAYNSGKKAYSDWSAIKKVKVNK